MRYDSRNYLEWLIDDVEPDIILDVLPPAVAVTHDAGQQPVVVSPANHNKLLFLCRYINIQRCLPVPDLKLPSGHRGLLLVLPQGVQLSEAAVGNVEHKLLNFRLFFLFLGLLFLCLFFFLLLL